MYSGNIGQQSFTPQPPVGGPKFVRLNFITPSDQSRFEDLFSRAAQPNGGKHISAMATRDILTRSRLDNDSLAKIWDLSSLANAPFLTFPEFAIAMYLTSMKLTGKPVPSSLPPGIRDEVSLAMATMASTDPSMAHHPPPPSQPAPLPPAQPQMPLMTGMMPQQQQQQQQFPQNNFGASSFQNLMHPSNLSTPMQVPQPTGIATQQKPRLDNNDFASKMLPNQSGATHMLATMGGLPGTKGSWKISPEEKERYRTIFQAWEPSGTGYLAGDVARQVLIQSGLPENDLMLIWNLADRDNRGNLDADEFAIAMHLIYRRLNGADLPTTLPVELAAPSNVLKRFVLGHRTAPSPPQQSSPTPPPQAATPPMHEEYDGGGGYVSDARRRGPTNRFLTPEAMRPRTNAGDDTIYEVDKEREAELDYLRAQIADTKAFLDRMPSISPGARTTSSSSSSRFTVEELKEKTRKTQEELTRAARSNPASQKYFNNAEELLDLLETQRTLQDEINYLCNRDIPVLARQLRSATAELRDAKVRHARRNDGSTDYMNYVQPTGPGGTVTESDRVRAKAKAMMAARRSGTSSSHDASHELRKAEDEKEASDRFADECERQMEQARDSLRDLRGDLRYLESLGTSKAVLDKKRFEKGQDLSYEIRRFVEQLERDAALDTPRESVTSSSYRQSSSSASPAVASPAPATPAAANKPSPAASPARPRTADEIKKEAERRVQERLAALQAKRGGSPRSPRPAAEKKPSEDELLAQERMRQAEQSAQARLRENDARRNEFSTAAAAASPAPYEPVDEAARAEAERAREVELEEQRRREAEEEERDLEARKKAVLEKEERDMQARREAIQKAQEEEEEKQRLRSGAPPVAPSAPAPAPAPAASSPPPPPPPPPPAAEAAPSAEEAPKEEPDTKSAAENRMSSNNPFAKLQKDDSASNTAGDKADKRVSYNPFAAFSAFSATKAGGDSDDESDDEGWDVVQHDDSDNEDEFPAAGSAKNLAGMLFNAMSQRQQNTGASPPPAPPPPAPAATAAPEAPAAPPPPPPAPAAPPAPVAPPAPEPAGASPPPASDARSALLGQIQMGTRLKKAVTNDRSAPTVAGVVHDPDPAPSSAPASAPAASSPPPAAAASPEVAPPQPLAAAMAAAASAAAVPSHAPAAPAPADTAAAEPAAHDLKEYMALWAYDGANEEELSFEADETILVHDDSDASADWWYGTSKATQKSGYFPKSYVQKADEAPVQLELPAKALYDYDAPEGEDILSFAADDALTILDKESDDWWMAKHMATGKSGLVPANYVQEE